MRPKGSLNKNHKIDPIWKETLKKLKITKFNTDKIITQIHRIMIKKETQN